MRLCVCDKKKNKWSTKKLFPAIVVWMWASGLVFKIRLRWVCALCLHQFSWRRCNQIYIAHTSCQLPDQICCTSGRADPSWVASHTIILHLYFIRYNWKIVAIWLKAMWSVLMVLVCLRTISIPIVGWSWDTLGEILLNGGTLRGGKLLVKCLLGLRVLLIRE